MLVKKEKKCPSIVNRGYFAQNLGQSGDSYNKTCQQINNKISFPKRFRITLLCIVTNHKTT